MNAWKTLYLKELKDNRGLFLLLLIASLFLPLYASQKMAQIPPYLILAVVPYTAVFILPFILFHSFTQEQKAQTHYLLLALPVRRSTVGLCKFLAVLSVGGAVFVVTTGALHLLYLWLRDAGLPDVHVPYIAGTDLWIFAVNGYFSSLLLLLGIASAMAGLRFLVARYLKLVMTAFFIGSLYLYGRLFMPGMRALSFLGQYQAEIVQRGRVEHVNTNLQFLVYSALVGLVFLGLGLWLSERYAEA